MRILPLAIALLLPLSACSCGDEPGGNGNDTGSNTGGGDATNNGGDGSNNGDGAMSTDGSIDLDGAIANDDGGNPLIEPLSDFCRGEGTVVIVGNNGDCAGEIAQNVFQFALCACDTISVQSTLEIDAFDSRLGTYGATTATGVNIQDDGHLGLNGELNMDGKLTVRGGAYIGGGGFSVGSQSLVSSTVYASGDAVQNNSSTTLGRNAFFDGDVVGRFNIAGDLYVPVTATISMGTTVTGTIVRGPIPSLRPCACEPDEILDIGAITMFGAMHNDNTATTAFTLTSTAYEDGGPGSLELPCGRYYLTQIHQPGGLSIRALGRTVLFVDGDMLIGGNFDLSIDPGAEVDLFVKGSLTVGASARFGDPDQPSKVRTYVGGDQMIVLSASAVFGGNLYAPRADVVFDASARLYGSLFAKTARFDGSANIHFDSAVRAAGDSCEEPVPGTDGGPAPDASVNDGEVVDTGMMMSMDAATGADGGPSSDGGDTPCMTDLDCRAPEVCVMGTCQINL